MIGSIHGTALLATLCAGAVVWPVAARAETVEYEAAPGCPDRGAFLAAASRKVPGQELAKMV